MTLVITFFFYERFCTLVITGVYRNTCRDSQEASSEYFV